MMIPKTCAMVFMLNEECVSNYNKNTFNVYFISLASIEIALSANAFQLCTKACRHKRSDMI